MAHACDHLSQSSDVIMFLDPIMSGFQPSDFCKG